jgi:hypothetical protein
MNHIPLLCDNESAIKITYNPCEHSRTKHIDIRHHFLRDHIIKGDIAISHVRTNDQLADIFTKPIDENQWLLWSELNIIDSRNVALDVAHLTWCLLFMIDMLFMTKNSIYAQNLCMLYVSCDLKPYMCFDFQNLSIYDVYMYCY